MDAIQTSDVTENVVQRFLDNVQIKFWDFKICNQNYNFAFIIMIHIIYETKFINYYNKKSKF